MYLRSGTLENAAKLFYMWKSLPIALMEPSSTSIQLWWARLGFCKICRKSTDGCRGRRTSGKFHAFECSLLFCSFSLIQRLSASWKSAIRRVTMCLPSHNSQSFQDIPMEEKQDYTCLTRRRALLVKPGWVTASCLAHVDMGRRTGVLGRWCPGKLNRPYGRCCHLTLNWGVLDTFVGTKSFSETSTSTSQAQHLRVFNSWIEFNGVAE
jgi:hypothetical protein